MAIKVHGHPMCLSKLLNGKVKQLMLSHSVVPAPIKSRGLHKFRNI